MGGFGRVFEARSANGELAVVKLIPMSPGAERELLFSGEGVCNVVPIIDSGEQGDDWAIVMPRADKSLRRHLKESGGVLPLEEAVKVLPSVDATTVRCVLGERATHVRTSRTRGLGSGWYVRGAARAGRTPHRRPTSPPLGGSGG